MKILFQGDSITDWNRSRTDDTDIGRGYPLLVKARLSLDYPEKFEFINRGIGGDTVSNIYARMYSDIISLGPDFMSIMVGTNDSPWSAHEKYQTRYERVYDMLIGDILTDLPNMKLMIMEPFVLPGERVVNEGYPLRREQTERRSEAAQRVAEKYGAKFLPLQKKLDEACKMAPVDYWTIEGVHITPAAYQILADEWIKAFKEIYAL